MQLRLATPPRTLQGGIARGADRSQYLGGDACRRRYAGAAGAGPGCGRPRKEALEPGRRPDQRTVPEQFRFSRRRRGGWLLLYAQRPAGHSHHAERGLEPDLAHDPADRLSRLPAAARRRYVRARRHHPEPFPVAGQSRPCGHRLGCRSGLFDPDRHRQFPRLRQVRHRPDGGRAEAGGTVDRRRARKPHLERCRRG
ncbi:hypothetical protein D9M72_500230 [compost metagenome]